MSKIFFIRSIPVKFIEQMQIQPNNIMENVNKVARTLIDRVGGFGTQVYVTLTLVI